MLQIKKYTITESAKILGVTRQSVYRKIKKLQEELQYFLLIENNTQYINKDGLEIIKNDLQRNKKTNISNIDTNESYIKSENVTESILVLQKQYENQIADLKEQFKNQISDLKERLEKDEKREYFYKERIAFFEEESLRKDKLLENMQVLLKEQKSLLEAEQKKSKWKFWKK